MSITSNIAQLKEQIHQAERNNQRPIGSVRLLAVSKSHGPEAITEAYHAGLREFGENYVQEALIKIQSLSHLSINWHFIGHIQSNKTKAIAEHFDWVHTLTSPQIAKRFNDARPLSLPHLNVCIQLNLDEEKTKSGVTLSEATDLAASILTFPRLSLRGLMVIPKPEHDVNQQFQSFLRVTDCLHDINRQLHVSMDTLSMGMSHDFESAIRAGSTLVRIGTRLFGNRPL